MLLSTCCSVTSVVDKLLYVLDESLPSVKSKFKGEKSHFNLQNKKWILTCADPEFFFQKGGGVEGFQRIIVCPGGGGSEAFLQ